MTDTISIEGLEIDCIVGILPRERDQPQRMHIDVVMHRDLATAGRSGRIADTCDYARVVEEITALVRFRRYKLLENAAEEIAAMVLGVHEEIECVELRLTKPSAIAAARTAGVRIERRPRDFPRRFEHPSWGEVEVLLETREAGLYLLHVAAGHEIPSHHHQVMRELEWLVTGELSSDGQAVEPAIARQWERGVQHEYRNDGHRRATLFCCDCPPFIREDEIVDVRGSA